MKKTIIQVRYYSSEEYSINSLVAISNFVTQANNTILIAENSVKIASDAVDDIDSVILHIVDFLSEHQF